MFFTIIKKEYIYDGIDGGSRWFRDISIELLKIKEVREFLFISFFNAIFCVVLSKTGLSKKAIAVIMGMIELAGLFAV